MTTVSGFLSKIYEIFNSKEYSDCCDWGPSRNGHGETIIIKKIDEFSKRVLPNFFKHSNFQSFVRQLNMYDFHKTVQDPNIAEFHHAYFKKDRPDLLPLIKRKVSQRAAAKRDSDDLVDDEGLHLEDDEVHRQVLPPIDADILAAESDAVIKELVQQRHMKEEFERRLKEVELAQNSMAMENMFLQQKVMEYHQNQYRMQERMENVLRVLCAYVTNTGTLPALRGTQQWQQATALLMDGSLNGTGANMLSNNGSVPLLENSSLDVVTSSTPVVDFDTALRSFSSFEFSFSRQPSFDGPESAGMSSSSSSHSGNPLTLPSATNPMLSLAGTTTNTNSLGNPSSGEWSSTMPSMRAASPTLSRLNSLLVTLKSTDDPSTFNGGPAAASTGSGLSNSFDYSSKFGGMPLSKMPTIQGGILDATEYTSERVTELGPENVEPLPKKQRIVDLSLQPVSATADGSEARTIAAPTAIPNNENEYLGLLFRSQEATLTRLDSLEISIASLLENVAADQSFDADGGTEAPPK